MTRKVSLLPCLHCGIEDSVTVCNLSFPKKDSRCRYVISALHMISGYSMLSSARLGLFGNIDHLFHSVLYVSNSVRFLFSLEIFLQNSKLENLLSLGSRLICVPNFGTLASATTSVLLSVAEYMSLYVLSPIMFFAKWSNGIGYVISSICFSFFPTNPFRVI